MFDSFGRKIDYLRLSVTDRCNLRCQYCMPPNGVKWIPHADILSFEEILRLVRVMAELGIAKIKVTGGEALTRRSLVDLIFRLKQTPGIEQVTLTSNGLLLDENLDGLINAGLDALNISLDTLNAETFQRIARSSGFEKILSVIGKINSLPFPVKINCVPIRGINDDEIAAIAGLAKDKAAAVRFIELMPLGCAADFEMLKQNEVMAIIEKEYGLLKPLCNITATSMVYSTEPRSGEGSPLDGSMDAADEKLMEFAKQTPSFETGMDTSFKAGNGPAEYYSPQGFNGKIGFISPMSHNFCQKCNRIRLSAAGLLMPCLSSGTGLDLRSMIRGNKNKDTKDAGKSCSGSCLSGIELSDDELMQAIKKLIQEKPQAHLFANTVQKNREMFRIGG